MVVTVDFSISSATCQDVRNIPWLNERATSGTVAAGNATNVTVTSNASGLSACSYGYLHLQTRGSKDYPATVLDYAYDADSNAITIP